MQECDLFDISDENVDALEYTAEELNRYYLSGHLRPILIDEAPVMDIDAVDDESIGQDEVNDRVSSTKRGKMLIELIVVICLSFS